MFYDIPGMETEEPHRHEDTRLNRQTTQFRKYLVISFVLVAILHSTRDRDPTSRMSQFVLVLVGSRSEDQSSFAAA